MITVETKNQKIKRQLELEQEAVQIGVKRYRDQVMNTNTSELPPGLALMTRAIEPLYVALEELKTTRQRGKSIHKVKEFLLKLDSYETAYITAKHCVNIIAEEDRLQNVADKLGEALITHLEYLKFKEEMPSYVKAVVKNLNERGANKRFRRTTLMHMKRKKGIEDTPYSNRDRVFIGTKLIELFIETTGLAERKAVTKRKRSDNLIMLDGTDEAKKWIEEHHAQCELLSPEYLPMIIEPRNWIDPYSGGFLNTETDLKLKLVKTRNKNAIELLENNQESMEPVYKALNTLQATKWMVNTKILEVMQEVWVADSGRGTLPQDQEEPLPIKPWGTLTDEEWQEFKKDENNKAQVDDWNARARDVYLRRVRNKSKRYQLAKKLWVANKFKDEEEIYFCWVLDWRGRVYPVQSHINPQGDDTAKALLQFATGKPLTKEGVYWLKVHLANTFGEDKISFDERVAWVDNHHDEIYQAGKDPLGSDFWESADEPWQFLAGAIEYKEMMDFGGEGYISHIPVAMDGSCNGLQNFAGMLHDPVGGAGVNLVPSEAPQDVYQRVADGVEELIASDNSNEFAIAWRNKVTRKITKRPVMTLPYGVTQRGMTDQIADLLVELDEAGSYLGAHIDNLKASNFLAGKINEAISSVLASASETMDWLKEVTKVANEAEIPFYWETPVGYMPYQDYKTQDTNRVDTYWGTAKVRVQLSLRTDTEELNLGKQVRSISPNFVHSMDASHMMLTSLRAKQEGIESLSMIHDSFGTHASDIPKLNNLIREEFVKMYTDNNVLEQFVETVKSQLPKELHSEIPETPKQGSLDLRVVLDSPYFFA